MNVFDKVMDEYDRRVRSLGNPLEGDERITRKTIMGHLNPNGFRKPPKSTRAPHKDTQGLTRRDRRLKRHDTAFANNPLSTLPEYQNSSGSLLLV